MEKVIFYWEWLPLPKAKFNILAMLAEQGGSFSGNYLYVKAWFVKQFPNHKEVPVFVNGKLRVVPIEAPRAAGTEEDAA